MQFLPSSSKSPRPWATLAQSLRTYAQLMRYHVPSDTEAVVGRRSERGIAHEGRTPSILCLHGFCGVPEEMHPLINAATSLGLRVRAPLLPGHGAGPEQLRPLRYDDWYRAAEQTLLELIKDGPVVLVGMSMGSLLATELALNYPKDVLGLCVLSNAFWVRAPFPSTLLRLVDTLKVPDFGYVTTKTAVPALDPARRIYNVQPVHAAVSVLHAAARLRSSLSELGCPTLIVHGALDEVCPVENAWRYARKLAAGQSQVQILAHSKHMVTLGPEQDQLTTRSRNFLLDLLRGHRQYDMSPPFAATGS